MCCDKRETRNNVVYYLIKISVLFCQLYCGTPWSAEGQLLQPFGAGIFHLATHGIGRKMATYQTGACAGLTVDSMPRI